MHELIIDEEVVTRFEIPEEESAEDLLRLLFVATRSRTAVFRLLPKRKYVQCTIYNPTHGHVVMTGTWEHSFFEGLDEKYVKPEYSATCTISEWFVEHYRRGGVELVPE